MRTQSLILIILITTTVPLLAGCSFNDQELKKGWWKYGSGYHVGDVISFKTNFSIHGDTLWRNGKAVAIITDRRKGFLRNDNELHIRSLSGNQSGIYHQK